MFENRVQYTPPSFGPFVWRKWWVLEPGCISKSCSKSAWSMSMTWLWTDLWWRLTCLWIAYSNPWKMLKKNWKPGNMRQNETNIIELPSWTRFCPLGVPTALYNHQQGAWKFCSHCSFEKTLENLNATGNLSSWNPRKGLRQDCSIASTLSSTQGLQLSFESQLLCRDVKKRGVGVPPWNLWIEEPQSAMIRKIWLATQKASSLHPSALRKTQRTTESMTRKRLWNSGSVFAPFTSSFKVKSPVPVTSWG